MGWLLLGLVRPAASLHNCLLRRGRDSCRVASGVMRGSGHFLHTETILRPADYAEAEKTMAELVEHMCAVSQLVGWGGGGGQFAF